MIFRRKLILFVQKILNATQLPGAIENLFSTSIAETNNLPPPIFILAPPRSGTTLIYEALISTHEVAYVCNAAALLYSAPTLATQIASKILRSHEPRFSSDIGFVSGLLGPSEAGELFRQWFNQNSPLKAHRDVNRLSSSMGGPVVLKNLYFHQRMKNIIAAFPNAVFLRVTREPLSTIESILQIRKRVNENIIDWWGPKPAGWETLAGLPPELQIAGQVVLTNLMLDEMMDSTDYNNRIFVFDYQNFCEEPDANLHNFISFYSKLTNVGIVRSCKINRSFDAPACSFDAETKRQILDFIEHAPESFHAQQVKPQ